jgi:hypothetical protein
MSKANCSEGRFRGVLKSAKLIVPLGNRNVE